MLPKRQNVQLAMIMENTPVAHHLLSFLTPVEQQTLGEVQKEVLFRTTGKLWVEQERKQAKKIKVMSVPGAPSRPKRR